MSFSEKSLEFDCRAFEAALEVAETEWDIPYNRMEELQYKFYNMMLGSRAPSHFFDFMDEGAFKECYEPYPGAKFVIKFASSANRTYTEQTLYENALKAGLADIFPLTFFIPLTSRGLPIEYLEESDDCMTYDHEDHRWVDNPDYIPDQLNYVILQAKCTPFSNTMKLPSEQFDQDLYLDAYPAIVEREVLRDAGLQNDTWVKDVSRSIDQATFGKLLRFLTDNHVNDLHNNNIGYCGDRPVIFDWLSD